MPHGWRRKILRLYSLEVATIHLLEVCHNSFAGKLTALRAGN